MPLLKPESKRRSWNPRTYWSTASHKKMIHTLPTFWQPKTLWLHRNPKYPRRSIPMRNKTDYYAIIKSSPQPGHWISHEEGWRQVKDNKHEIKQAGKKFYDIVVAKINTLIKPDGERKIYIWLNPDYYSLDVATKIRIIWTEYSWLILNTHIFPLKTRKITKV